MNTLKGILQSLNTGMDRGITHGGQLAQLFAQKRKMEMLEEQREMERAQANYQRAMTLIGSGSEAGMKLGTQLFTATAKKNFKQWGADSPEGVPDFTKVFMVNKGSDELDAIIDELTKVEKMEINPQDKGAMYADISRRIMKLPQSTAKEEIANYHKESAEANRKQASKLREAQIAGKIVKMSQEEKKRNPQGDIGYGAFRRTGITEQPKESSEALLRLQAARDKIAKINPNDPRIAEINKRIDILTTKETKPEKPEDYDKILRTLHREKASLAAKKGFSELDLMFAENNPAMQEYMKNNDVAGALAEYDKQIEKYTALRDGVKPKEKYKVGEVVEKGGNKYKYIGGDKWQKL
jgi:hypothetical protein